MGSSRSIIKHVSNCSLSLLILIIPALWPTAAFPVTAAPILHELSQPDGFVFPARQWGDEYSSGWETREGFTIVLDEEMAAWTYAEPDSDGALKSSGHKVSNTPIPFGLNKRLRPKNLPVINSNDHQSLNAALTLPKTEIYLPSLKLKIPLAIDSRNIPVILINFSDTVVSTTATDFNELLFGDQTWSFKDYYDEVSYGRFSVSSGPAGVVGWVTASQPHDYYGKKSGWGPPDAWPGDLAYEAVQQADATVDFSAYDNNGDCYVDTVAIIHQGAAQEATGNTNDIWSHSWSLSQTHGWGLSHYGPYTTNDPCTSDPSRFVVVDRYIMMPEILGGEITTIGVFVHEYGHALGLIDLYDSDYSSEGVGNWSAIAAGDWAGVTRLGDRPVHLDPWSKAYLGWIDPVKVNTTIYGKTINEVETSGEVYQILDSTSEGGSGEYFLIENRQKTGFDAALPGSGLLIWHIDDKMSSNRYESYPGCTNCPLHYKVALVQADNLYNMEKHQNRGDAGDPFPGSTNNRTFNALSLPNSNLYSGASSGVSVSSISDSCSTMRATFITGDSTGLVHPSMAAVADGLLCNCQQDGRGNSRLICSRRDTIVQPPGHK